ncbi:MAG: hypothetical protein J5I90_03475 [Caldilineales bacterium]|nr:hypothetical protein [Caldilineales bacterium]
MRTEQQGVTHPQLVNDSPPSAPLDDSPSLKSRLSNSGIAIGIAVGLTLGVLVGMYFDAIGVALFFGLLLGLILGAILQKVLLRQESGKSTND